MQDTWVHTAGSSGALSARPRLSSGSIGGDSFGRSPVVAPPLAALVPDSLTYSRAAIPGQVSPIAPPHHQCLQQQQQSAPEARDRQQDGQLHQEQSHLQQQQRQQAEEKEGEEDAKNNQQQHAAEVPFSLPVSEPRLISNPAREAQMTTPVSTHSPQDFEQSSHASLDASLEDPHPGAASTGVMSQRMVCPSGQASLCDPPAVLLSQISPAAAQLAAFRGLSAELL
jgi:hypothetical protein